MGKISQEGNQAAAGGQQLIRAEVLEARGAQWLGAIRVAQPVASWLVVALATVIGLALVAFVCLGSVTRKARVAGITVPASGSLSILAPNGGVLAHSHVQEGQHVEAGQVLFDLSTERQGGRGEVSALVAQQLAIRQQTLEAERRARLAQDGDRRHALEQRRLNAQAEAGQLEREIALAQRRLALAQKSVEKFELLQGNGFVSAAQTQQKQEELIDLESRLAGLARNKVQLQATAQALDAEQAALATALAGDLAQLDRAVASLEQEAVENRNRSTNLIVAPEAGTVTAITYQPGQAVLGGQVLATVIPQAPSGGSELEAHLYAPSRTIGFIAPGQPVLIRLHAFPYEKFGLQHGVIQQVSKTPFAPAELPSNLASTILGTLAQSSPEGLYRVKVKLQRQDIFAHGQLQALRPGMTLEADVVQERRTIWEWIADPLLAIAHR